MKKLLSIPALFLILGLFVIQGQPKPVYKMLGKTPSDVIKVYGQPNMHDKSDPVLEMMFYKMKDLSMCFVASSGTIFQAEMNKFFNTESEVNNEFMKYVNASFAMNYTQTDSTANSRTFKLNNTKINLSIDRNAASGKYFLYVKALKAGR